MLSRAEKVQKVSAVTCGWRSVKDLRRNGVRVGGDSANCRCRPGY